MTAPGPPVGGEQRMATSIAPPDTAAVLASRGHSYGECSVQFVTAQRIKEAMRNSSGWRSLDPVQREALEMMATKLSRVLDGDPRHVDSWQDMAGYALLIVGELSK